MAFEVFLSEEATDDLFAIWHYIAVHSGERRADAIEARLSAACSSLEEFPDRGSPHDELAPAIRSIPVRRHATIFYRVESKTVEVVRILYAGMDVAQAFDRR
jgi:toxin ParE1/3/4